MMEVVTFNCKIMHKWNVFMIIVSDSDYIMMKMTMMIIVKNQ